MQKFVVFCHQWQSTANTAMLADESRPHTLCFHKECPMYTPMHNASNNDTMHPHQRPATNDPRSSHRLVFTTGIPTAGSAPLCTRFESKLDLNNWSREFTRLLRDPTSPSKSVSLRMKGHQCSNSSVTTGPNNAPLQCTLARSLSGSQPDSGDVSKTTTG